MGNWQDYADLDVMAIEYNTIRVSGVVNMFDVGNVFEIAKGCDFDVLYTFIETYGNSAYFEYVDTVNWNDQGYDTSMVDYIQINFKNLDSRLGI